MTRAEAIVIASKHNMAGHMQLVDCLVALGVLKLDEPESLEERLWGGIEKARWNGGLYHVTAKVISECIEAAGLRIVDARSQGEG